MKKLSFLKNCRTTLYRRREQHEDTSLSRKSYLPSSSLR